MPRVCCGPRRRTLAAIDCVTALDAQRALARVPASLGAVVPTNMAQLVGDLPLKILRLVDQTLKRRCLLFEFVSGGGAVVVICHSRDTDNLGRRGDALSTSRPAKFA